MNIKIGFKKAIGILLIVIGLLALVTPFTPGSWLIFVGLEFFGFRTLFWDKIKSRFQKYAPNKIKRTNFFIIVITLALISFVLPLAMGY
jgi:drug/metabolite transporter (DMT)-like permease